MGYDPQFAELVNRRLQQLEKDVADLKASNAPRSQIVDLGAQAEKETSQIVGNAIQSAYDRIEQEIEDLRQQPVTPEVNTKINNLIAMKQDVPYHFTVSQGDQEWLNERINSILGANSSN